MENRHINIDGIDIEILIKKVKNINLRINREGKVSVSISKNININRLQEFLYSKKEWIKQNVTKITENNKKRINNEKYRDNNIIKIFDKEYKIIILIKNKNKIYFENNNIIIELKNIEDKENFLNKFLDTIFKEELEKSLNLMLEKTKIYNIKRPDVLIRKMKTRWGTCNIIKKKITINSELINYKKECLDYVVLHELIHFKERKHNTIFYKYIENIMPKYKEYRKLLKEG